MTDENQTAVPNQVRTPVRTGAKTSRAARPQSGSGEKVRAELNLEKWPGVWQPSKSKNEKVLRVLEREVVEADGSKTVSQVEIGYTHLGTLTTEERKMYGALLAVWEENGKPADRPVFFSDRMLARILRKSWGTNVRDAIVKSLRKLRTVPIEWINSYYQKTEEGKTVLRERTPFTILSDLKIVEKEVDGSVNRAVGYFKTDDRILKNLLANFTKPLLLAVMVNLKSDIAVLLYSHVDLMLARKDSYERRSKELFVDLGLTNTQYNRQYERYRALKKAVAELQGVRLSTGVLKIATVEKTMDGQDYKTVFRKVPAPSFEPGTADLIEDHPQVVINHYAKAHDPLTLQAEQVILHFHQLVHKVSQHEPQSKELGQALALITQHGLEKTKHIVCFAAARASETNFNMQHFGAVLSYASRGAADFDELHRVRAARPQSKERATPQPDDAAPSRGMLRLAILTREQYEARFAAIRADLFRRVPFLERQNLTDSSLLEGMVRARLIAHLDCEVMELVPLAALQLPEVLVKNLPLRAA